MFALAWLLSEFAVPFYYWELDIVSHWQLLLRRRCLFSVKIKRIATPPQLDLHDSVDDAKISDGEVFELILKKTD